MSQPRQSSNAPRIRHIRVFFTPPDTRTAVECGLILVSSQYAGFVYHQDYNGPVIDPAHLNYRRTGSKKFQLNPSQSLHGVFAACLPEGFGLREFEKARPEYRQASPAERLFSLGSRHHGPFYFECVEDFGGESAVRLASELDRFREQAVNAYLGRTDRSILTPATLKAATYYGGDRPKVRFQDRSGVYYVAKFNAPPSVAKQHEAHDRYHSLARVEYAATHCLQAAQVNVAESIVDKLPSGHDVFFSRDFAVDATDANAPVPLLRIPMHVLGDDDPYNMDYLAMERIVRSYSADPEYDLRQLFARMIIDRALNNLDNHAGNFEMVLQADGWRLAPAFDVAPSPEAHKSFATTMMAIEGPPTRPFDMRFIDTAARRFGISLAEGHEIARRCIARATEMQSYMDRVGVAPDDAAAVLNAMPMEEMRGLLVSLDQSLSSSRQQSVAGPSL